MANPNSQNDPPGTDAWRAVHPYWTMVSIYDGPVTFLRGFEQLPEHVRHLFAIRWCDYEVCNGGFRQFLSNSTGVLAPEAADGFRAVGLDEFAELVDAAIGFFQKPFPRDRAARQEALAILDRRGTELRELDSFRELNGRYYAGKKRVTFDERLDEYARRHA
jgi:Domain of unknown function (DUF4375)